MIADSIITTLQTILGKAYFALHEPQTIRVFCCVPRAPLLVRETLAQRLFNLTISVGLA